MNQNMKNKIGKLILGNAGFAAGFVLLYSPGLLGLRPSDPSIIKAALSITMGVLTPLGVVGYNYSLLGKKAEHRYIGENTYSAQSIREELQQYLGTKLFGQVASSSMDQLAKCESLQKEIEEILQRKFNKGSLTYQKFAAISESAKAAIFSNMAGMLNRMRVIDDAEYSKLLNYKNDDIPDDIQIQRLELYNKNIEAVKEQRNQNEKLLFKLDELMLELAASEITDTSQVKAYAEIDTLIKQIQYYQD